MKKYLISMMFIFLIGCVTMKLPVNNFDLQNSINVNESGFLAGSYIRNYYVIMKKFTGPLFKMRIDKIKDDGTVEEKITLNQTLDLSEEKKSFFFQMNPGKYNITKIEIGYYEKKENVPFTIEKGGILYLGHYVIGKDKSLNITYNRVDDSQNVINTLKAKHPLIENLRFVNIAR